MPPTSCWSAAALVAGQGEDRALDAVGRHLRQRGVPAGGGDEGGDDLAGAGVGGQGRLAGISGGGLLRGSGGSGVFGGRPTEREGPGGKEPGEGEQGQGEAAHLGSRVLRAPIRWRRGASGHRCAGRPFTGDNW